MVSIKEAIEAYRENSVGKCNLTLPKLIVKSIFAGMMIALGASGSNVAAHAITNVGLARFVASLVFPVGLMMVILTGSELFTGDCMMVMAVSDKKISAANCLRVWFFVFFGNFIGAFLLAAGALISGQFDYSAGLLGAYTIKVALGKVSLPFFRAFISGILCNILVCAAVLMAGCAKDVTGKLLVSFFVIMLFVTSGYEHCVANMYYISAGLLAKGNPQYLEAAKNAYGLTAAQLSNLNLYGFLIKNLIPVTLGNIVGGGFCFGLPLYLIYRDKK